MVRSWTQGSNIHAASSFGNQSSFVELDEGGKALGDASSESGLESDSQEGSASEIDEGANLKTGDIVRLISRSRKEPKGEGGGRCGRVHKEKALCADGFLSNHVNLVDVKPGFGAEDDWEVVSVVPSLPSVRLVELSLSGHKEGWRVSRIGSSTDYIPIWAQLLSVYPRRMASTIAAEGPSLSYDRLKRYLTSEVFQNNKVVSVCVAFERGMFQGKENFWLSAEQTRSAKQNVWCVEKNGDYRSQDWYSRVKRTEEPRWTYFVDEGLFMAYSVPFYWHQAFAGVVCMASEVDAGLSGGVLVRELAGDSSAHLEESTEIGEIILRKSLETSAYLSSTSSSEVDNEVLREKLTKLMREVPEVFGASIGFQPSSYRDEEEHSIYVYRIPGQKRVCVGELEGYLEDPLFCSAVALGRAKWSSPYFSQEMGDTWVKSLLVPFRLKEASRSSSDLESMSGVLIVDVTYQPSLHSFFYDEDVGAGGDEEIAMDECEVCGESCRLARYKHSIENHSVCIRCFQQRLIDYDERREGYNLKVECQDIFRQTLELPRERGLEVKVGQYIQLRHVKSGKFLSMKINQKAEEDEKGGRAPGGQMYAMELEEMDQYLEGSRETWIKVVPVVDNVGGRGRGDQDTRRHPKGVFEEPEIDEREFVGLGMSIGLENASFGANLGRRSAWQFLRSSKMDSGEDVAARGWLERPFNLSVCSSENLEAGEGEARRLVSLSTQKRKKESSPSEKRVEAWAAEIRKSAKSRKFQSICLVGLHASLRPFKNKSPVPRLVSAALNAQVMQALLEFPMSSVRAHLFSDLVPYSSDPSLISSGLWDGLPASAAAVKALCALDSFAPSQKQINTLFEMTIRGLLTAHEKAKEAEMADSMEGDIRKDDDISRSPAPTPEDEALLQNQFLSDTESLPLSPSPYQVLALDEVSKLAEELVDEGGDVQVPALETVHEGDEEEEGKDSKSGEKVKAYQSISEKHIEGKNDGEKMETTEANANGSRGVDEQDLEALKVRMSDVNISDLLKIREAVSTGTCEEDESKAFFRGNETSREGEAPGGKDSKCASGNPSRGFLYPLVDVEEGQGEKLGRPRSTSEGDIKRTKSQRRTSHSEAEQELSADSSKLLSGDFGDIRTSRPDDNIPALKKKGEQADRLEALASSSESQSNTYFRPAFLKQESDEFSNLSGLSIEPAEKLNKMLASKSFVKQFTGELSLASPSPSVAPSPDRKEGECLELSDHLLSPSIAHLEEGSRSPMPSLPLQECNKFSAPESEKEKACGEENKKQFLGTDGGRCSSSLKKAVKNLNLKSFADVVNTVRQLQADDEASRQKELIPSVASLGGLRQATRNLNSLKTQLTESSFKSLEDEIVSLEGLEALTALCLKSCKTRRKIFSFLEERGVEEWLRKAVWDEGVSEFLSSLGKNEDSLCPRIRELAGIDLKSCLEKLHTAMFVNRNVSEVARLCGLIEALFVDTGGGLWRRKKLSSTTLCIVKGRAGEQYATGCVGVTWRAKSRTNRYIETTRVEGLNLFEMVLRFSKSSIYSPEKNNATLACLKLLHAVTVNDMHNKSNDRKKAIEQFEQVLKTWQFPDPRQENWTDEWLKVWRMCKIEAIAALHTIKDLQLHARVLKMVASDHRFYGPEKPNVKGKAESLQVPVLQAAPRGQSTEWKIQMPPRQMGLEGVEIKHSETSPAASPGGSATLSPNSMRKEWAEIGGTRFPRMAATDQLGEVGGKLEIDVKESMESQDGGFKKSSPGASPRMGRVKLLAPPRVITSNGEREDEDPPPPMMTNLFERKKSCSSPKREVSGSPRSQPGDFMGPDEIAKDQQDVTQIVRVARKDKRLSSNVGLRTQSRKLTLQVATQRDSKLLAGLADLRQMPGMLNKESDAPSPLGPLGFSLTSQSISDHSGELKRLVSLDTDATETAWELAEVVFRTLAECNDSALEESLASLLLRLHCTDTELKRALARIVVVKSQEEVEALQGRVEQIERLLDEPSLCLDELVEVTCQLRSEFGQAAGHGPTAQKNLNKPHPKVKVDRQLQRVADVYCAFGVHDRMLSIIKAASTEPLSSVLVDHCYAVLTSMAHLASKKSFLKRLSLEFPVFLKHASIDIGGANRLCTELLIQKKNLADWCEQFVQMSIQLLQKDARSVQVQSLRTIVEAYGKSLPAGKKLMIARVVCETSAATGFLSTVRFLNLKPHSTPSLASLRSSTRNASRELGKISLRKAATQILSNPGLLNSGEACSKQLEDLMGSLNAPQIKKSVEVLKLLQLCATDDVCVNEGIEESADVVLGKVAAENLCDRADGDVPDFLRQFLPDFHIAVVVSYSSKYRLKAALLDFLLHVHTPQKVSTQSAVYLFKDFNYHIRLLHEKGNLKEEDEDDVNVEEVMLGGEVNECDRETSLSNSWESIRWVGSLENHTKNLSGYVFDSVLPFITSLYHRGVQQRRGRGERLVLEASRLLQNVLLLTDLADKSSSSTLANCIYHLSDTALGVDMVPVRRSLKALEVVGCEETSNKKLDRCDWRSKHSKSLLSGPQWKSELEQLAPLSSMFADAQSTKRVLERIMRVLVRAKDRGSVQCQWIKANHSKFIRLFLRTLAPLIKNQREHLVESSNLVWMLCHLCASSSQSVQLESVPLLTACVQDGFREAQDLLFQQHPATKQEMLKTFRAVLRSAGNSKSENRDPEHWKLLQHVLRLLKEMCEGHHELWQDGLRAGVGKRKNSCDLVTEVCSLLVGLGEVFHSLAYWDVFCPDLSALTRYICVAFQSFRTLSEMCQGPCEGNQVALSKGPLFYAVNFLWYGLLSGEKHRGETPYGRWDLTLPLNECGSNRDGCFFKLQIAILDSLHAMLEGGQGNAHVTVIAEKMEKKLNWDMVKQLLAEYRRQLLSIPCSEWPDRMVHTLICRYVIFAFAVHRQTSGGREKLKKKTSLLKSLIEDETSELQQCHLLVQSSIGTVEILNRKGRLEQLFFVIPSLVLRRRESAEFFQLKQEALLGVPRDNPIQKTQVFLEKYVEEMVFELLAFDPLKRHWVVQLQPMFLLWSFRFCLLLNLLAVVWLSGPRSPFSFHDMLFWSVLKLTGLAHLVLTVGRVISLWVSRLPLMYFRKDPRKAWQLDAMLDSPYMDFRSIFKEHVEVLKHSDQPWFEIVYLLASFLGLFYSHHFYCVGLFDIVDRISLLSVTVRSLWSQATSLVFTTILWFVIVYNYAVAGHLFFPDDYPEENLEYPQSEEGPLPAEQHPFVSLWRAILFFLNHGLRAGGGIGDILEGGEKWKGYGRMVFDLTFFLISTIIMANIVSGTIIDAFGESRDKRNEVMEDQTNYCFICSLPAAVFDRHDRLRGFQHHCQTRHNMWQYVYFVAYVMLKDDTELTGTESFVLASTKTLKIDWLPVQTASLPDGVEINKDSIEEGIAALAEHVPEFLFIPVSASEVE